MPSSIPYCPKYHAIVHDALAGALSQTGPVEASYRVRVGRRGRARMAALSLYASHVLQAAPIPATC